MPDVLSLPPSTTGSGDDVAPYTISKVPQYTYYDHIWLYSEMEALENGYTKEAFVTISALQRLNMISALEKPKPITLTLSNQILASYDEHVDQDSLDSDTSPIKQGDKLTRIFFIQCFLFYICT